MTSNYFSDRERGHRPLDREEIDQRAWRGLKAIVDKNFRGNAFAHNFPITCNDGNWTYETDVESFSDQLMAEIPDIDWPLNDDCPGLLAILDLLEFCHKHIAEAGKDGKHSYFRHDHLSFDQPAGQKTFREDVNRILSRNGVAFELKEYGSVERLIEPVLAEQLITAFFHTGDASLDSLLENARKKFLAPNIDTRSEALKDLWDAWERLKTIEIQVERKKRESISILLDRAASGKFREYLEKESKEVTQIGNNFGIRHSETYQNTLDKPYEVDYLFHRMFALIHMLLTATQRLKQS